ncbi:four-domain proteases inhibitor-like [Argopecten irradians]|uniref:four-domain proteases inhibitor-like n=1 Tax=Argopecten irradians TaxID=31199 RepID=UPI003717727E
MKFSLAILVVIAIFIQVESQPSLSKRRRCSRNGRVCGIDGRTYANECSASIRGIGVACERSCPCLAACTCSTEISPVCGNDGNTYSNACMAGCEGVGIACRRTCPCVACRCTEEYQPVCGTNGKTYVNDCHAACENVRIRCQNACPCRQYGK